jgi:hypothetical protein
MLTRATLGETLGSPKAPSVTSPTTPFWTEMGLEVPSNTTSGMSTRSRDGSFNMTAV